MVCTSAPNTPVGAQLVMDAGLNCYQIAAVEVLLRGGELVSGWALDTAGVRRQHVWVERNQSVFDHMEWSDHTEVYRPCIDGEYARQVLRYMIEECSSELYTALNVHNTKGSDHS